MRQQLRLRVLVPVAVLGLLGAGFGAFAMGGPAAPESILVHPTSSAAVDTGATDTGATDTGTVDTAPTVTTPPPAPTTTEAAPAPAPAPEPEQKTPLQKQLAAHRVVVVVFHSPGSDVDAQAVREARAGAAAANAGYLAVNVTKEKAVEDLAAEYEVLEAPTVLVIVRGGELRSRLEGVVDRQTVAQAVTNALR